MANRERDKRTGDRVKENPQAQLKNAIRAYLLKASGNELNLIRGMLSNGTVAIPMGENKYREVSVSEVLREMAQMGL